jgi:putative DNA primase/helicase
MSFHILSMFCLASVQVGIKYQADVERMTVLSLRPKETDQDPTGSWNRIKDALYVMQRDETLPGRLMRRSLELLPITLQNIVTFSEAAAQKFGSQRDGDQYGTLLAGAWSLTSRDLITLEAARAYMDQYDWSEHRENAEVRENERALAALMGSLIRVHGGADVTVNELIRVAVGQSVDGVSMIATSAEAVLQRHGMRTSEDGKRLIISNGSAELRRLMEGTPFEADLRRVLLTLPGADRYENKSIKFAGVATKAISLPLDGLLDDDVPPHVDDSGRVEF